jgi:hypothetical protein
MRAGSSIGEFGYITRIGRSIPSDRASRHFVDGILIGFGNFANGPIPEPAPRD